MQSSHSPVHGAVITEVQRVHEMYNKQNETAAVKLSKMALVSDGKASDVVCFLLYCHIFISLKSNIMLLQRKTIDGVKAGQSHNSEVPLQRFGLSFRSTVW